MIGKRAQIPNTTINLIIGAVVLVGLFYLLSVSYSWVTSNSALEQATSTLNGIMEDVESKTPNVENKYVYLAPRDWNLVFYLNPLDKPACFGERYCLCLCENSECSGKFTCKKSTKEITMPNYIRFEKVPVDLIIVSDGVEKATISIRSG